ncbi:MAG: hypothetical protein GF313_08765 [Caldithrix sp.]|nr:hypothetical protein [Caldithrix sp.]
MPFQQLKEILDHIKTMNEELKEIYLQMKQQTDEGHTQLLLDYANQQKSNFEKNISDLNSVESSKVFESWFQYTPEDELKRILQEIRASNVSSVDDVAGLTIKYTDALIDFYKKLKEKTHSEDVTETIDQMIAMHERNKQEFITSVQLFKAT